MTSNISGVWESERKGTNKMIDIITQIKRNEDYLKRLGRMALIAEKIVESKDPFGYTYQLLPSLDHIDAYILGMISGEIIHGIWFVDWGKIIKIEIAGDTIRGEIIGTTANAYVVRLFNGNVDIMFRNDLRKLHYTLTSEISNTKYEKQLRLIGLIRNSIKHVSWWNKKKKLKEQYE